MLRLLCACCALVVRVVSLWGVFSADAVLLLAPIVPGMVLLHIDINLDKMDALLARCPDAVIFHGILDSCLIFGHFPRV